MYFYRGNTYHIHTVYCVVCTTFWYIFHIIAEANPKVNIFTEI